MEGGGIVQPHLDAETDTPGMLLSRAAFVLQAEISVGRSFLQRASLAVAHGKQPLWRIATVLRRWM